MDEKIKNQPEAAIRDMSDQKVEDKRPFPDAVSKKDS